MAASSGQNTDPGGGDSDRGLGAGLGKEINGIKIGEPQEDYDVADSVCYSFQWFLRKEIDGVSHAQCLLCLYEKEEARNSGKSPSNSRKKKQDCLKAQQGTTKRKSLI